MTHSNDYGVMMIMLPTKKKTRVIRMCNYCQLPIRSQGRVRILLRAPSRVSRTEYVLFQFYADELPVI
jgi:hypothetical protein